MRAICLTAQATSAQWVHAHENGSGSDLTVHDSDGRFVATRISVMVLAIANRQNLADHPHMQEDDDLDGMEQLYCGSIAPDADGSCVREPGHSGRHKYRSLTWQGEHLN